MVRESSAICAAYLVPSSGKVCLMMLAADLRVNNADGHATQILVSKIGFCRKEKIYLLQS